MEQKQESTTKKDFEIVQTSNPVIIKLVEHKIAGVVTESTDPDYVISELYRMFESRPEDIIAIVILYKDNIVGFAFCWLPDNRDYAWIGPTWSNAKVVPHKMTVKAFSKIKHWAYLNNKSSIRMETERDSMAFSKSFGFKEQSVIMSMEI